MPFRHRQQAVEILRLDGEELQFQQTELAGTHNPVGIAENQQTVTDRQLPGLCAGLHPVAGALRDPRHQPSRTTRHPFGGGRQNHCLQHEMSFDGHAAAQVEGGL